jgi:uncharacterized protein
MKFTLDARPGINLIRAYSAEELRVGERIVVASCIVTADTLITDWRPAAPGELSAQDLEPLFALEPQIVLLGIDSMPRAVPASVRGAFAARQIAFEVMELGAACRTFNILVQEERRVAAALFLKEVAGQKKAT